MVRKKLMDFAVEIGEAVGRATGKKAARKAATDDLIAARRAAQTKRPAPQDVRANPRPKDESFAVERKKRKETGTVNIGLKPSEKVGGPNVSRQQALRAIRATGRRPRNLRVLQSASEPTLVADVQPPLSAAELHDLSAGLRQDAIAQRTAPEGGMLEGPRANAWGGEFNPAYFYLQGGDTLGSSLMTDKFRAGATRQDLTALADKWGRPLDPVALDINLRMRDAALASGQPMPESLGQFTGRAVQADPVSLQRYREAEKRLREREIAARGATDFGLRRLSPYLEQLPPEDDLRRILRETQLPTVGLAPDEFAGTSGRGVHISRVGGLSQVDPSFFGTGHRGEEYAGVIANKAPERTYMYVGPEGTLSPEPSVMGVVGDEMRQGPRYAYTADLENLYDINVDPEGIRAMAQAYNLPSYEAKLPAWALGNDLIPGSEDLLKAPASYDMERWIKDRGYRGYLSDFGSMGRRAAAVYGPTDVTPISDEPIDDWRRKFAVGGRV